MNEKGCKVFKGELSTTLFAARLGNEFLSPDCLRILIMWIYFLYICCLLKDIVKMNSGVLQGFLH